MEAHLRLAAESFRLRSLNQHKTRASRSGSGAACLQLVFGVTPAAEKKAQLKAGLQPKSCPPVAKVSSGEERTGCKHWRRRSWGAGVRLGKARACDGTGEPALGRGDKVHCAGAGCWAERCDPAPNSRRQHTPPVGDSVTAAFYHVKSCPGYSGSIGIKLSLLNTDFFGNDAFSVHGSSDSAGTIKSCIF